VIRPPLVFPALPFSMSKQMKKKILFIEHIRQSSVNSYQPSTHAMIPYQVNTKGGSITVPLTSCLTGLESAV
jgi:hypothetical protein